MTRSLAKRMAGAGHACNRRRWVKAVMGSSLLYISRNHEITREKKSVRGERTPASISGGAHAALIGQELYERIDLVFVKPMKKEIKSIIAITTGDTPFSMTPGGLWPSDHAGVVARIKFSR